MKGFTRIVFTFGLLLSASQTVWSQSQVHVLWDEGSDYPTLISGAVGPDQRIRQPGSYAFLYGIQFGENSDEPCYLKFYWWRHDGGDFEDEITTQFDICGGSNGSGSPGDFETLELPNLSGSNLKAVHAINVATKDSGSNLGRIKGARIFGSYINRYGNGDVERDPALQQEFNRKPNKTQWESKQACDPGDVAVGVVIEYEETSNSGEIVGLGLLCATPEIWTVVSSSIPAN